MNRYGPMNPTWAVPTVLVALTGHASSSSHGHLRFVHAHPAFGHSGAMPTQSANSVDSVGQRGVLVTAAGPQMHDVLHDLALPTFARYAMRWNYALSATDLNSDGARADPADSRPAPQ